MRFRLGLLTGLVAGYVLGTRAGRERYEQIARVTADLRRHPAVAQIVEQVVGVVDLVRNAVAGGLRAGSEGLRNLADDESA
jgi:hypothetical protein